MEKNLPNHKDSEPPIDNAIENTSISMRKHKEPKKNNPWNSLVPVIQIAYPTLHAKHKNISKYSRT